MYFKQIIPTTKGGIVTGEETGHGSKLRGSEAKRPGPEWGIVAPPVYDLISPMIVGFMAG